MRRERLKIQKGAVVPWLAAAAGMAVLVWSFLLAPQMKPAAVPNARALTPASSPDRGVRPLERRTEAARVSATTAQEAGATRRAIVSLLLLDGAANNWHAP